MNYLYNRTFALDGIEICRSAADGRTVEAYAAVFDTPAEIHDRYGDYMETIARSAFDEAIARGPQHVGVFYHHAMTMHGTPSDLGSVPIGSPVEIRADGRGLRTVTRYNKSQLADSVLEAIRNGDIRGYSFRGPIHGSNPRRVAKARPGQPLPSVTRTKLGLIEYGPTPVPAYTDAGILAIRSAEAIAAHLAALDDEARAELIRMLAATPPSGDQEPYAPPATGPGAEDQPARPSVRQSDIARAIRAGRVTRGIEHCEASR